MTMSRPRLAVMMVAAAMLCGCMPDSVKQIESNKDDYMQTHFAVSDVTQQVAATIAAADSKPMGFHKMVLTVDLTVSHTSDDKVSHFVNSATYTAVGGPYLQALDVLNNNGVPFQEDYSLTYRGLFSLRSQRVQLNAINSNMIIAVHSLQPIAAWPTGGPGSGDIDFHYDEGFSQQIMNFQSGAMNCKFGDVFPAAQINPVLHGNAQKLHCTGVNNNGVVVSQSDSAWLMDYGVVFVTQLTNSDWVRSWKLAQVQVQ